MYCSTSHVQKRWHTCLPTHTHAHPCKFKNSKIWGKKERKNLSATTDGHWTVRFTSMVRPCCHAWIHCLFTAHGCFDMVVSSFAKCTLDSKILKIIIQDSNLRFSVVDSLIPACVRHLGLAVRFYFECTMLCTKSRGTTTMCYGGGGRRALSGGGLLNLYHYSNQPPYCYRFPCGGLLEWIAVKCPLYLCALFFPGRDTPPCA